MIVIDLTRNRKFILNFFTVTRYNSGMRLSYKCPQFYLSNILNTGLLPVVECFHIASFT